MNPYYTIALAGFTALLAALLIRFVNRTVDGQFRALARAADDAAFRKDLIARLTADLGGAPLPEDASLLPRPRTGIGGALPPVLTALGAVLLWGGGGGAERAHRDLWLYGGLAALAAAGGVLLLTLRRRKWARTARMLLFRADLRRMDGDRSGAAEDLRLLLRLTPWDDAAWAELSDDLAVGGDMREALDAMERAASLDPEYDEYAMLRVSLALRLRDFPRARAALAAWRSAAGADGEDPRVAVYGAALDLAEGRRSEAEAAVRAAVEEGREEDWAFAPDDRALDEVRAMLP